MEVLSIWKIKLLLLAKDITELVAQKRSVLSEMLMFRYKFDYDY